MQRLGTWSLITFHLGLTTGTQQQIVSFFLTLRSSMTPTAKLDISEWKLPTDLQLADEAFNHLLL
jgi:hypothetical protein